MRAPSVASRDDWAFGASSYAPPFAPVDPRFRERILGEAALSLATRRPDLSARRIATTPQIAVLIAAGLALTVASAFWPRLTLQVVVAAMSAGFVVSALTRSILAWLGCRRCDAVSPVPDQDLPSYTVLVPLFQEANMLPQLADALHRLDYPRDRLDVKLVVEEDDHETVSAALQHADNFDVLIVPPGDPRTKPKACNYALHFARGELLVIYDAEDRPEPDQLRKAAARFRGAPPQLACLQARLGIYNGHDSWLAGIFALDYGIWFKALLPGLDRLAVPMPLGGTSNHFRTAVLREVGAWDPFNVTEDADLGIRLARLGYRVRMLDSTTFEEAPSRLGPWLRQRTRWMKGFMQTLLVHTRSPRSLLQDLGAAGAACLLLFLAGAVWSALVNPLLWGIFLASCAIQPHTAASLDLFARFSGVGLLVANTVLAGLALADRQRAKGLAVVASGVSFVLYWGLISAAAYRAVWHLLRRTHHWEKTPHGREAACGGSD